MTSRIKRRQRAGIRGMESGRGVNPSGGKTAKTSVLLRLTLALVGAQEGNEMRPSGHPRHGPEDASDRPRFRHQWFPHYSGVTPDAQRTTEARAGLAIPLYSVWRGR